MPAKVDAAQTLSAPPTIRTFVYAIIETTDGQQEFGFRLYGTTGTMEPVRCLVSPDDAGTLYDPGTPEHATAADLLTAIAGFVEGMPELAEPEKRPAEVPA